MSPRCVCGWAWIPCWLAAVLQQIRRRGRKPECAAAPKSSCNSARGQRRRRLSCLKEAGIRMTTGFSKTKEEERHATKNRTNDRRENLLTAPGSNRSMRLGVLLEGIEASVPASTGDRDTRQGACDSRRVRPHAFFFALQGAKADGNAFIGAAGGRGATAIASEEAPPLALPA